MAVKFTHLHVHTEYSLLDGLSKISQLLIQTKALGMNSIAITDHGTMYGAVEFYRKCLDQKIKPIIGMEAYISNVDHRLRPERGTGRTSFHLTLLAKNREGYQNLMKITSLAHLEGYYYRPRIDKPTLAKYSQGLICLSGCPMAELGQELVNQNYSQAKKISQWYLELFGPDYFLEIQRHEPEKYLDQIENPEIKEDILNQVEQEKTIGQGLVRLSRDLGIPLVATNDSHYIRQEDALAQDALICIATAKNLTETKRLRYIDVPTLYLRPPQEMAELFNDLPEAIENTVKIAKKCNLEITLGQWFFPKVDLPDGISAEDHLRDETRTALKEKYGRPTKELKERVDLELKIICDKNYAPYFLIYKDMADWARENNIPINTRGSAAGSLVSYVLGITSVDPIKYNLPFERFLNPYRPSLPDIDLDIADDRREEMIMYLTQKYGQDKVAQICTFGRMLARGSVRDTARVLGYAYDVGDRISKLIPFGSQGFPMTIEKALGVSEELASFYDTDEDAKKIIDLAQQVEGNARHISVHAAGLVIAPQEITNFSPIQKDPGGEKIITQYEMHACEEIGLVKLDVLGIRHLSILRGAVKLAKIIQDQEIDIEKIPLDDRKTFKMLAEGGTMGVFQLSSAGMTKHLKELKPTRIEDLMAMVALYRPGPMANIPEYIARKKGQKKTTYYHPKMKRFLDKSFGILVYQDDLLFTALELAGYDWKSVDKFRKAVGKKIPEEMARQHKIFVQGCIEHSGMTQKQAEGLWNLFEPFQGYGFNKAHAASYGMVAYQTAYMKANFPVEYMTALMSAEANDKDKVSAAVNECRRMKIKVLPPEINQSLVDFTIIDDSDSLNGKAIRFGLNAVKNVGKAAIEAIMETRESGDFESFLDFISRVDNRRVNKKVLESLIKVGALAAFGSRAGLLASIDRVRDKAARIQKTEGQQGLFSPEEVQQTSRTEMNQGTDVPELTDQEIQTLERQLLGLSLSAKPIAEILNPLLVHATHRVEDLDQEGISASELVRLAGIVTETRVVITRKTGAEMAFVKIQDETGTVDLVVFPKIFAETKTYWIDQKPILVSGRIDNRGETAAIILNSVETKETLANQTSDLIKIRIPRQIKPQTLKELKKILQENQGDQETTLVFEANGQKIKLPFKINWNQNLADQIRQLLESSQPLG